jgi:hypothetical protein
MGLVDRTVALSRDGPEKLEGGRCGARGRGRAKRRPGPFCARRWGFTLQGEAVLRVSLMGLPRLWD